MYRVLLPLDSSDRRAAAQARAVTALPDAANSVTATLLHVFEKRADAGTAPVTQLSSGSLVHDALTDAGVTVETETRHGDPTTEILDVARERDVDSIVLGGRAQSSLGKLLFGSVTQAVVSRTERPVTIAPPDGTRRDENAA